ncbi:MAG: ester cyclase, partial [Cyanobacteria bacterium J06632_3]
HSWKIQGEHTGTPLFGVEADGKEITLTGITIVRIEDGKIAERWTQLDQLGLMQQLGLIPPAGGPA